jgi:EAL domain-containing protein (putative c-di-GMP-specific phosphodiesterase class I)/GGDEF domain-containing protein
MGLAVMAPDVAREWDVLVETIEEGAVYSVFQPIVDVGAGSVWGYEVLSRGEIPPLESPAALFSVAASCSLDWEAEEACREAALASIGAMKDKGGARFFFNVSPSVFMDPRFIDAFTPEVLRRAGLSPEMIVLEITEQSPVDDDRRFSETAARFRAAGIPLALDDLGAGFSGLRMLILSAPQYLKLDMTLVRDIQNDGYRRQLVRTLCDFAAQVDAKIVAEGVETLEELQCLVRLGVRYAQGYLFASPARTCATPPGHLLETAKVLWAASQGASTDTLESIDSLVRRCLALPKGGMRGEDVHRLFRKDGNLDHFVVLDGAKPVGLVTREGFSARTGGAFGYHLHEKRPVESLVQSSFLSVPEGCAVTELASLAMERSRDSLYDPVVVVDEEGAFVGTVTMKQIVTRAGVLEVEMAKNSNPLSGLPGNRQIERWIKTTQEDEPLFSVVYADLDRFKEFNDRYGFLRGDRLIRLTAEILQRGLSLLPPRSRLGHVGGDDFVFVVPGEVSGETLEMVCTAFDEEKRGLFSTEDFCRGCYEAETRTGERCTVPLVTLSLAVVESRRLPGEVHPGLLVEVAASLKKKVKQITAREGRSFYFFDRRDHGK